MRRVEGLAKTSELYLVGKEKTSSTIDTYHNYSVMPGYQMDWEPKCGFRVIRILGAGLDSKIEIGLAPS